MAAADPIDYLYRHFLILTYTIFEFHGENLIRSFV